MERLKKENIIAQLQEEILRIQKFCRSTATVDMGLGSLAQAFPNHSFPLAAIHEFLSLGMEDAAATTGFVSGLLASIMGNNGAVVWISSSRKLFPPALKAMNIEPDRFIFLDLKNERDVLWAMDEALKCGALSAVIGEIRDLSFTESRRLQLAVEQSQVTGFVLRHNVRNLNTTASVSRWKITTLHSETDHDLPGIGFPRWQVELLRMRNGKTGVWNIQWERNGFVPIEIASVILPQLIQKAG
ncbi:ImuA family protein [soil metagenome]